MDLYGRIGLGLLISLGVFLVVVSTSYKGVFNCVFSLDPFTGIAGLQRNDCLAVKKR